MTDTTEVRQTSSTGAQKGSKLARYDLIPAEALKELAELYGRGAAKYAERNWEAGYDWSLSFAALQRHAWQFWNGEDYDEETGSPHMASVAWHALALVEYMTTHREFDNRPAKAAVEKESGTLLRRWTAAECDSVPHDLQVEDLDGDIWMWSSGDGGWQTRGLRPRQYLSTEYAPYTEVARG